MSISRRVAAIVVGLGMTAVAVVAPGGSASAGPVPGPTSPNTAGAHSWTVSIGAAGGTRSTGTLAWNNTAHKLTMRATTGLMASNYCVTVYFDWRATGHHDSRAVRNCKSNSTYAFGFPDSNPSNLLGGPKKLGICYGLNNQVGNCNYWSSDGTQNVVMNWTPWPNLTRDHPCILSWAKQSAAGATASFLDPHSQRNNLQANGAC